MLRSTLRGFHPRLLLLLANLSRLKKPTLSYTRNWMCFELAAFLAAAAVLRILPVGGCLKV